MKVRVLPYDPAWPEAFEAEKLVLEKALGDAAVRIHHIGSTSVEGLAAKPIIDILLEVVSLEALDAVSNQVEAHGYEGLGEFGIERRRYFRKGGDERTHQIHAFPAGDPHVARHVAFRDYLRAYPDVCEEYVAVKRKAASSYPEDVMNYNDGKDGFIKEHEAKALAWEEKRSGGLQPPSLT